MVSAPHAEAVERLDLLAPDGLARLLARAGGPAGRARNAVVRLGGDGVRLHVRPVRHGGALAPLLRGALLGLERPLAELRATRALAGRDVPVPAPVLVAGRRRGGPIWEAALGTLHVEDARDGLALVRERPGRSTVLRAAEAAGRAVRRFHDAGGRHADLTLRNLLFADDGRVLLCDLDGARVGGPVHPDRRMREVMRLYRSLAKRDLVGAVGRDGCAAFLESYTSGDHALRDALLAHLPRERLRLAVHRLAWWVQPRPG